jgi:8-oxo-dGTP pyrophosphatase MutT (NUDIX family)
MVISRMGLPDERIFTASKLRLRAANRLHRTPLKPAFAPVSAPSDYDLNPDLASEIAPSDRLKPAAVLVPVIDRPEPGVLLTLRTSHLSNHAGQISFPGGKVDESDRDEEAAALREALEEIGLEDKYVEPLGYLDPYRSGSGYLIQPLVGIVRTDFVLRINPQEVDDVFEVPLSFLMDAANHQRGSRQIAGGTRHFHAMPYGEHYIWGVTAGIIRNMYERLHHE